MCEADPGATFFSTPDWCRILVSAFSRFRPMPYLFIRDGRARCLVPAVEVRRVGGRLCALHSMPFGTYGGIVGCGGLEDEEVDAVLAHVLRSDRRRFQTTVYPNPLGPPLPGDVSDAAGVVYAPDLTNGFEGWCERIDGRVQYHARKAQRRGVVVETGMNAERFETFARHYLGLSRFRSEYFGAPFFRALWTCRSARIDLWSAHRSGKMLAAILTVRFQRQLATFLSIVTREGRRLGAKHLIYLHLVERACDQGSTAVNFLGSGGHQGVAAFKESLGCRRRPFGYVNRRRPLARWVIDPARRLRARVSGAIPVRGDVRLDLSRSVPPDE